ncbi:MAG: hypothetical protein OXN94_17485 [Chloroflexota bacterium]|nr:hypothetical protein [Chloroflexota bacterium]
MDSHADAKAQDFVDDITGALQQGNSLDPLVDLPDGAREEVVDLVSVIQGLRDTLLPVEPSAEFAAHLKTQLLESEAGLAARLRKMPARLHVAAILALFAGFSLLLSRRLFGASAAQEISEEPVATAL